MAEEGTPIPGEVEEKARRMGWVDKDQFKGDPDRWVEANKFVERGENELPIMRERLKHSDANVKKLLSKVNNMEQTFAEFQKYTKENKQKEIDRAIKNLTEKQRVAVEESDTDKFDSLEKEKNDLLQEQLSDTTPQANATEQAMNAEIDEWIADGNEWFVNDPELSEYAVSMSSYLVKTKPHLTGRAYYDELKKEVVAKFPDKFGKQQKVVPNIVEGGTDQSPPPKGKRTYANLPADAKATCDKFIATIPGFTKEEYLENYDW